MPISVLILTLDEEQNLPGCLDSLRWCDDIVILDSGSTDATVALAARAGARVIHRDFDDYASQRNFGLRDIEWRHPWVLMVDADERVPQDLVTEMQSATTQASSELCLFRMRRKDYLFGTWIRGSGGYPTWFPRLARVGRVWVARPINEEYLTDGLTGELACHLHHFPFNKGMSAWVAKHNRYSSMEAEMLVGRQNCAVRPSMRDVVSTDPLSRRRALKYVVYRMPFRPMIVFLGVYVLRLGFLEGRAGLTFALLRSWYEFLINVKVAELKRRARKLPV